MANVNLDLEVLDCISCFEHIKPPIYQCSNGHITCTYCCARWNNKCCVCQVSTGRIRCLALEKLIESMKVSCKYVPYGCGQQVSYSELSTHETGCMYAPDNCPIAGCDFSGNAEQFPDHFGIHGVFVTNFKYVTWTTLKLIPAETYHVLQSDGTVFLLQNETAENGNRIMLKLIAPSSSEENYTYQIRVRYRKHSMVMESIPKSLNGHSSKYQDFLMVPSIPYKKDGLLNLELRICHS